MRVKSGRLCILSFLFAFILTYRLPAKESAATQEADPVLEADAEEEAKAREKERVTSVLSFDLGWLIHGFTTNGVALGINYERLIVPHFSLRGTAGAMLCNISELDVYAVDVSLSLYANWYPLSRMLDKLYVGVGATGDFMCYFGGSSLPDSPTDELVSITPVIGWKQNIANVVVLDFYGGYSFVVFNSQRISDAEDYIRSGVQLGIRFKILWRPGKSKAES